MHMSVFLYVRVCLCVYARELWGALPAERQPLDIALHINFVIKILESLQHTYMCMGNR